MYTQDLTGLVGTDCEMGMADMGFGAALVPNPRDSRSAHVPGRKQGRNGEIGKIYIRHSYATDQFNACPHSFIPFPAVSGS